MKKLLIGFSIFLPVIALSAAFPSSGLDFDTSTISITGPSNTPCLGQLLDLMNPVVFSLTDLEFSNLERVQETFGSWGTNTTKCFQTVGAYQVEAFIVDNVGNTYTHPIETFNITSAAPDENTSEFFVTCNGAIANGVDFCDTELHLRDRFENDIVQTIPNIGLSAPETEAPGDANLGLGFRAGLRIGTSQFLPSSPAPMTWDIASPPVLQVTALAPSLEQVETNVGGAILSYIIPRTIDFVLTNLPGIDTDGSILPSETFNFSALPATLRFAPPVEIFPGFEQERIAFGDIATISNELDTSGILTGISNFVSDLKSVSSHLFLDPSVLPDPTTGELPAGTIINESVTFSTVANEEKKSIDKIVYAIDAYDEPNNISITTTAEYVLDGQTIRYPAGAVGTPLFDAANNKGYPPATGDIVGFNLNGVDIKNIGISIEGIVMGNQDQMFLVGGDGNNKLAALSSLHSLDIRENIIKNAYQLIRNATDVKTEVGHFDWEMFDDKDVVVLDLSAQTLTNSTLELAGPQTLPSGKNTLIVLNGNVRFQGNHEYDNSAEDSFGLILLRDEAGPEPIRGNIFVESDVQKLSGTLFADGGFFNNNSDDMALVNTDPRDKQLRIVGSLLAKNTIGGSRRVDEEGNFFTPWGTADRIVAKRYDLHEIRKYDVDIDPTKCVMDSGICDANIAAFILRLDQKSTLMPPPGFLAN